MYYYEVYIRKENIEAADWYELTNRIYKYVSKFELEILLVNNELRFYIVSEKDLTYLSTDYFVLCRTEPIPAMDERGCHPLWTRLRRNNLIQIAEIQRIKHQRTLSRVRIVFNKLYRVRWYTARLFLVDNFGKRYLKRKLYVAEPPFSLLELNFTDSLVYKKKPLPIYLKDQEITTSPANGGFLNLLSFPNNYQKTLSLANYDFDKHSLIVGQTGVGKSKLIALFIKELEKSNSEEFRVVVIDPHASLVEDLKSMGSSVSIDFIERFVDLFPRIADPNIGSELTILLLKTLLGEQFNSKLERVLKYSLYTLFSTNQMTVKSLRLFLTDLLYRKELLQKVEATHIKIFFDSEFVELQTKFYETSVMPILAILDELSFLPVFQREVGQPINDVIENNFLTCLSLDRMKLGEKLTRLIAGLIIQQVFLYAQSKVSPRKILLIIDEVPVVENDSFKGILAEARKFGLSLFLSAQHLSQISEDLSKAILANTYNFFVFKVGEEDAKLLGANLKMEFDDKLIELYKDKGYKEEDLKVKMLTGLNQQECVVRAFHNGVFQPCFKAKTVRLV